LTEEDKLDFLSLLNILGDSGIGAERSAGYGGFSYQLEEKKLDLQEAKPNGKMVLLSRFYPVNVEDASKLEDPISMYDLVFVAGRVQALGQADQRRRGVHLVAEGSIVRGDVTGGLAKVKPEVGNFPHEVYRYGLAFGVGLDGNG
jgi:CRISPR type III-A-associated RAMP protein Csm4